MRSFKIIEFDFNSNSTTNIDIMPVLVNEFHEKRKFDPEMDKWSHGDFVDFVKEISMLHWWGKCEHEFIMKSWPYKTVEGEFRKQKNIEDLFSKIKFAVKQIEEDGEKLSVYDSIIINVDLIADMLEEEIKGGRK